MAVMARWEMFNVSAKHRWPALERSSDGGLQLRLGRVRRHADCPFFILSSLHSVFGNVFEQRLLPEIQSIREPPELDEIRQ